MQGDIHTGRMRFAFRWLAWAFALFAAANGPSRPSAQKRKGQKSQKASAPRERRQISRSPNLESPQVPSRVPAPPGLASSWMRPRLGPRRRPRKQYTGCAPSAGAARLLWPWSTNGRRAVSTPPLTRSPAIPRPPLSSPVSLDDHEPLTRAPTTDVMETDALVWGGGWRPVPAISHCGWAGSALDSVLNAHAWGAAEAPWKRLAVATCPRLSPPSNWSPERLQVAAARPAAAVPPPAQAGDAPWTPAAASLPV